MLEFPPGGENMGWGIYFEEVPILSGIAIWLSMTGLLASLAFGVCWNVIQHDIQGAWGFASWIPSVVPLAPSAD
jgi:hypothetical protein